MKIFTNYRQDIYSLAFSQRGNFIVTGSGEAAASILNVRTGEQTIIMDEPKRGTDASVSSIAISPDEMLVATGALDGVICIWNIDSGNLIGRILGNGSLVYWLSFLGSEHIVAASNDKMLRIWRLQGPTPETAPMSHEPCSSDHAPALGVTVNTLDIRAGNDHILDYGSEWQTDQRERIFQLWEFPDRQIKLLLDFDEQKDSPVFLSSNG